MVRSKSDIFLLIIFFISIPLYLFAQEKSVLQEKPNETVESATQIDVPVIQDGELKLLLDKIEIIGELEKPQAVFIIPGKNPEIDDIRIKRSFFNDIFRTVERKGRIVSKIQTQPTQDRKDYIPW